VKTVVVQGGGHDPSTAKLDSLRAWLDASGFLTPVSIRPGPARARLNPPAHALRPGRELDALGRTSLRPTGPRLNITTAKETR
jgi:hypothetical protein